VLGQPTRSKGLGDVRPVGVRCGFVFRAVSLPRRELAPQASSNAYHRKQFDLEVMNEHQEAFAEEMNFMEDAEDYGKQEEGTQSDRDERTTC